MPRERPIRTAQEIISENDIARRSASIQRWLMIGLAAFSSLFCPIIVKMLWSLSDKSDRQLEFNIQTATRLDSLQRDIGGVRTEFADYRRTNDENYRELRTKQEATNTTLSERYMELWKQIQASAPAPKK